MAKRQSKSGLAKINNAGIYFEMAGEGTPFIMIHAGVADSRQWNNEFRYFSQYYQVVRYDKRGYGKSEPVNGEFSHMGDLISLLIDLDINDPVIIMGCSNGGSLAMDFSLSHPSRVKALIMVAAGPSGLELDVPAPVKFAEADKAFEVGDLDLVAEIETQIWFDGSDRTPGQVNQVMRKLAYEMGRKALSHEVKKLGKRSPNTESPAINQLSQLACPVLVIVGVHDTAYILAAAEIMIEKIRFAQKEVIEDAAHLPNMDQPEEFQRIVKKFLEGVCIDALIKDKQ